MKMRRILASLLAVAISSSLLLAGCSKPQDGNSKTSTAPAAAPKVLKVNNSSEPGSLHPGKAQGTHDSWVLEHVMEGLTKKSPEGKIVNGQAEKFDISSDGLTYTFTLRKDIKWSNGDPVVAKDFEIAWKYCLNPATGSEYAYQLYYIKGGQAYNETKEKDAAKLKALEDAVGVKAKDDKTLVVTLEKPTPYFDELVSFYTYYPVNSKAQESNANWANEANTYVSNGAFKMAEWKHKESIKIAKNENYYDKDKIKLSEIQFAMIEDENTAWQQYQSGEIDLLYPVPQEVTAKLKKENNPELTIAPDLSTYFYRFNVTKKPFNNVKVRQAFAMAIDRKAIVENVTMGGQKAAFGMTPAGIPMGKDNKDFQGIVGDLFKENVDEAKKLLAEGLKEEGMDKLSFTILYNTSAAHKKVAEAIQEMWRKNLGVDVKLENVEFQVKIDREDKLDYVVSRAGWIGDYVDPMTFLDMWEGSSQQNDTGWKNADYDKLINRAKVTQDKEARLKDLVDAEKLLLKEMPIMPIYFYTRPFTSKPYVKGIYKVVNRYPQMHYIDIEGKK
ncbi:MAG: peptide-binding protein [Clostridiales bacterium]|nr:peptide-binding protein [Clostridiales bacterium]